MTAAADGLLQRRYIMMWRGTVVCHVAIKDIYISFSTNQREKHKLTAWYIMSLSKSKIYPFLRLFF